MPRLSLFTTEQDKLIANTYIPQFESRLLELDPDLIGKNAALVTVWKSETADKILALSEFSTLECSPDGDVKDMKGWREKIMRKFSNHRDKLARHRKTTPSVPAPEDPAMTLELQTHMTGFKLFEKEVKASVTEEATERSAGEDKAFIGLYRSLLAKRWEKASQDDWDAKAKKLELDVDKNRPAFKRALWQLLTNHCQNGLLGDAAEMFVVYSFRDSAEKVSTNFISAHSTSNQENFMDTCGNAAELTDAWNKFAHRVLPGAHVQSTVAGLSAATEESSVLVLDKEPATSDSLVPPASSNTATQSGDVSSPLGTPTTEKVATTTSEAASNAAQSVARKELEVQDVSEKISNDDIVGGSGKKGQHKRKPAEILDVQAKRPRRNVKKASDISTSRTEEKQQTKRKGKAKGWVYVNENGDEVDPNEA